MTHPLAGIESVPWGTLRHAYGPATDLPELLKALLSKKEGDRKAAWNQLYGNILHQSTVYEATPHAVPFLIKLVEYPETPAKHEVLLFLACVYSARSERDIAFERQTQSEVALGAPSYLAALRDDAASVRIAAAYLLGLLRVEDIGDEAVVEEIARSATRIGAS